MRIALASLLLFAACAADPRGDDAPDPDAPPVVDTEWLPGVSASALATDATHLYLGGRTLARVPLGGGTPETLYTMPPVADLDLAAIEKITVGPTDVVFVQSIFHGADSTVELSLIRVPLAGGAATTLATSRDQRAFLGVTIAGSDVIYSTFTAIYRVPLAGGTPKFAAQSPESIRYWIFSPTVVGENLVWAEDAMLYSIPLARTGEGTALAELPGVGTIIGGDASALVVALSSSIANQTGPESFIEIDPVTGAALGAPVAIGHEADQAIATESDVWAATWDGLVRTPRGGGTPEIVITTPTLALAVSADAVFAPTETGIARITR